MSEYIEIKSIGDDSKIIDDASKRLHEGFESKEWMTIEEKLSSMEMNVINSLVSYVSYHVKKNIGDYSIDVNEKKVITDQFYSDIRPIFVDAKLLSNKKNKKDFADQKKDSNKKNKKKIGLTKDEIRNTNAIESIKDMGTKIIKTFNMNEFSPQFGLQSKYIEYVGMSFIYMSKYLILNKDKFKKDKNLNLLLSIMVSMQRFIDSCSSYMGNDPIVANKKSIISQMFMEDMNDAYNELDEVFPFDGFVICEKVPELLVYSQFDQYVQMTKIRPREHQMEILNKCHVNMEKGFFIVYNAMIGSGKTTSIVALAELAKHHGKKLLCVCNLKTVQIQMGNLCYNANLRFGVAHCRDDGSVKITPHWQCKNGSIDIIICGPDVANSILNDHSEGNPHEKYILFHDEPTTGADAFGSESLNDNAKIMMNAPKWTVFSSATSPTLDKLSSVVIDNLKQKYNDLAIDKVYSPTVQVSCEVRSYDGNLIVPYVGCKNKYDVLKVIQRCNDLPFIGRMMTPNVALDLYNKLNNIKSINANDIPDIKTLFKKVSNMKADSIRVIIINMLNLLSSQSNDIIKNVCQSSYKETYDPIKKTKKVLDKDEKQQINDNNNDDDFGFEWEESNPSIDDVNISTDDNLCDKYNIDFMNMGTGVIWGSMTLIADNSPDKKALELFGNLISKLNDHGIKNSASIVSNFKRELNAWNTIKEKTIKNLVMSDIDKLRKEDEFERTRPRIEFPQWAHIGSHEYNKKFINEAKRYMINDIRPPIDLETIDVDSMNVSNEHLLLLFCGVGIYSPSSKSFDKKYTATVLDYASKGKLAYLVADNSISFGTNYPFGKVIVSEDFSLSHSIYTLFQLMGRAGRVGKLAKASAFISQKTGNMIIDFILDPDSFDIEIKNIAKTIEKINKENKNKLDDAMMRLQMSVMKELNNSTNVTNDTNIIVTSKQSQLQSHLQSHLQSQLQENSMNDNKNSVSWDDDDFEINQINGAKVKINDIQAIKINKPNNDAIKKIEIVNTVAFTPQIESDTNDIEKTNKNVCKSDVVDDWRARNKIIQTGHTSTVINDDMTRINIPKQTESNVWKNRKEDNKDFGDNKYSDQKNEQKQNEHKRTEDNWRTRTTEQKQNDQRRTEDNWRTRTTEQKGNDQRKTEDNWRTTEQKGNIKKNTTSDTHRTWR